MATKKRSGQTNSLRIFAAIMLVLLGLLGLFLVTRLIFTKTQLQSDASCPEYITVKADVSCQGLTAPECVNHDGCESRMNPYKCLGDMKLCVNSSNVASSACNIYNTGKVSSPGLDQCGSANTLNVCETKTTQAPDTCRNITTEQSCNSTTNCAWYTIMPPYSLCTSINLPKTTTCVAKPGYSQYQTTCSSVSVSQCASHTVANPSSTCHVMTTANGCALLSDAGSCLGSAHKGCSWSSTFAGCTGTYKKNKVVPNPNCPSPSAKPKANGGSGGGPGDKKVYY